MWTVLLVEDEAFVRRSIRKGMPWEENGFKVIEECGNGQEALEFIRNKQPDLVICDIMMPVLNGCRASFAGSPGEFRNSLHHAHCHE
ncbi:YesN/AraC family two-component response regulator [Paenibacillus sp. V4I3]|uniref:response regulator n=1 Tax=Paenibacillus sp. V4I3 TaxID=3042305 RepID=UPI0027856FF0|nr:YesN/AraC family two-component response regulator [Paenibacillus sp. V4I3]